MKGTKSRKRKCRNTGYVCTNADGTQNLWFPIIGKFQNSLFYTFFPLVPFFSHYYAWSNIDTCRKWFRDFFLRFIRKTTSLSRCFDCRRLWPSCYWLGGLERSGKNHYISVDLHFRSSANLFSIVATRKSLLPSPAFKKNHGRHWTISKHENKKNTKVMLLVQTWRICKKFLSHIYWKRCTFWMNRGVKI